MTSPNRKNCLIVVPMKDPTASKTRLNGSLRPHQRQSLARHLFKRTLGVLKEAQGLLSQFAISLAVVTGSEEAADIARGFGVIVIPETGDHSLSGAANSASMWAREQGYDALCIFPADLASPDVREICQFITYGLENECSLVCPSLDHGTNAILVSPPDAVPFRFGHRSSVIHMRALADAGLEPVILSLDSLRFDIDTAECLEQAADGNADIRASLRVV